MCNFVRDEGGRYHTPPGGVEEQRILDEADRILRSRYRRGRVLRNPVDAREMFRLRMAELKHEVFAVLFLDARHRVIAYEELFRGTIDGASVHPREVARRALETNAAAVVFAHNHPSGNPEPSEVDKSLTKRLRGALGLIEVRVLDHIVVGAEGAVSFAERGLL